MVLWLYVNKASKLVRLAKRDFERKIAKNIKKDSKTFSKYARSKTRVKSTIGPLIDGNGGLTCDDQEMGQMLNAFFASVFTTESVDELPECKNIFYGNEEHKLSNYHISSSMVKDKLLKLKLNKAPGVDLVGTNMLVELADEISDTVAELFTKSLTEGEVPPDWKLANVTPIFKKGNKSNVSNYRPVSLTVNLCKVFESIMRDEMIKHLQRHSLIKSSQHGFVSNRSCLTNLLVFMEEVTSYIDKGYPIDVIYLDFQKAFDKVPHKRLLLKLVAHGIDGNVLKWIENWLKNRKQRVVINGCFSDWSNVISGVPQGSVLGPLLFIIYINDIDECVAGKILKFADDTKIYHTVYSDEEVSVLQSDLRNLVQWSKDWQMLFNADKCKVMHIGFNNKQAKYDINDIQLECVSDEKDLGIIVSEDLKWDKQCSEAVKKANRMLGMIKRNFSDRSQETIMALYKSLVRPHLEYCCQIWSPYYKKDIKLIEGVQKRATKLVTGMKELNYNDRLKQMGLQRLEGRRRRSDLIETFKIVNRKYDINPDLFFQMDEGDRRGHDYKLFKKRFRLNVRKYFFSNRVIDNWNSLSANCINCSTTNTFKRHLSSELESETVKF